MKRFHITILLAAAIVAPTLAFAVDYKNDVRAATEPATGPAENFAGEHSTWHGFDRYDFKMDEKTLEVRAVPPKDASPGRACVVVAPKTPAPGNPWSWQGCYWDHEPQTEIELLKRGFHVAYITADATLKPDKKWEAWYDFLTAKHALAKKPAFVGMSRGGEYTYIWATTHPDKVACIYGDNPGGNPDNLSLLEPLAKNDVPILHVCGSIDPILLKYSTAIENIYQQFGGRISVMIKEGAGHHPHSLRDPKPIADFIEQSVQATLAPKPANPDFVTERFTKFSYYSLEATYMDFPSEKNYLTLRGPLFTPVYDRYEIWLGFQVPVTVIAPKTAAAGKPWVFRPDFVARDAVVDQGLLAKGFHIVVGPTGYNADGPVKEDWDKVYTYLTGKGFSKKPVLEGAGGAAGEALAWATENPDKVSMIYLENPLLRARMTKKQPMENLEPLAKAGVPMNVAIGEKEPAIAVTEELHRKYKDMSGAIHLDVDVGRGHFPTGPRNPEDLINRIVKSQDNSPKGADGSPKLPEERSK